jgi:predicted MPP superfamily phosphohydrolase
MVHRTLRTADKHHAGTGLKILLAHHPDAFDSAVKHGVALTLAGHTHGGQVVLANGRGKKGSLGLGSMTFQYPRGLYRRGNAYLYVNSGVGSWFPVRINCPPEIALLTLRAAPTSLTDLPQRPGEPSV